MDKDTNNNKKKSGVLVMPLIYCVSAMIVGFFLADSINKFTEDGDKFSLLLLAAMAIFYIELMISIIIHELGHLVCGLATGYEFVSFRVGSLTLIRENGRLVRRKFTIAGTAGQCILTPKFVDDPENYPYFWYHFGGGFFNLCTVVICVILMLISSNKFADMAFMLFAAVSFVLAFTNLVPAKMSGMPNDGYNIYLLNKSSENRILLYNSMALNGLQYSGMRLKDMPARLFNGADPEGDIYQVSAALLCANREMDRLDFVTAREQYKILYDNEKLVQIYKNESQCELLFTMIITGVSKEECEKLYDKRLKQYIKATGKTYIMRKRLMYAYYLILVQDKEKAAEEYHQAISMKDTYPCKGEYTSEMEIIEYIKENYGLM